MFEEVGVRKDGEYDDDNNNSPLMSGILTRPGAELKPDWTAVWWKHVLAAVLGHILYLKDKMLFFFKNIACGGGVRRCVEREFLFELRATVQRMDQTKTLREGDWVCIWFLFICTVFVLFFFRFFSSFFFLAQNLMLGCECESTAEQKQATFQPFALNKSLKMCFFFLLIYFFRVWFSVFGASW